MNRTSSPAIAGRTNRVVAAILTSRFHWLLSRWLCVVDYRGRTTGRRYMTPTQYVADGTSVTILVGKHDTKTWWRNFRSHPHPMNLCLRGTWHDTTATAVTGDRDPARAAQLLEIYVATYPRAAKLLAGDTIEQKAQVACFVACSAAIGHRANQPGDTGTGC